MSAQLPLPSEDTQVQVTPPSSSSSRPRERAVLSISINPRSLWLGAALVLGILVTILIITEALGPLILLLISIIIGEAIRPLVARLQRYHIPPPLAILLIYLIVLAVAGLLIWLLISPLFSQISSLVHHLPEYQKKIHIQVLQLQQRLQAKGALGQAIQNLATALALAVQHSAPALLAIPLGFLSGFFGVLISVVVILTMTLFWLLSSGKLKQFMVGLFPPASQEHAAGVIAQVGRTVGGYVHGSLIRMVLIGTLSGIGLAILQVPYALLLGMLAGLTELIPYLGPWISGSVAVVLALIAVGPPKALEVAILFILVFELEGSVVQPLVMSRLVHIDPLLVVVAVLVGLDLLGIIGAILAVPVAAAVQVVVVQVIAPAIRRASSSAGSATGTASLAPSATLPPIPTTSPPNPIGPEPPRPHAPSGHPDHPQAAET